MLLSKLLENVTCRACIGETNIDIEALVFDSRKDCRGALFVCISGTRSDAHDFVPQVLAKGAAAIVAERAVEHPDDVCLILVDNARLALAQLSAAYFDYPARKLLTIGITGTKGKTTTAHMIKAMLEAAGKKVGLIGTNGICFGEERRSTMNTTPESYELQKTFAEMVEAGCDCLVMEVSSQGLKLHRVAGIEFDFGVFTNLSPDHIGPSEHESFEEYAFCKSLLFRQCRTGIVNADDKHLPAILDGHSCHLVTYGTAPAADYRLLESKPLHEGAFLGSALTIEGKCPMSLLVGVPGYYNGFNALCAAVTAREAGASAETIARILPDIRVDGRVELVWSCERFSILTDYAHNGFSAENLLATLREYRPKRLVVVFGCGGNRDPHRRYEMGEVAGRMADFSIITSDNSRYEKTEDIIRDIHIGFDPTGGACIDIPNRREAIEYAVSKAEAGDLIAVIGKGHEDYQEENGQRIHFLDREVILEAVEKFGGQ